MKAGLLGSPGSGKTTLFNALTALHRTGHAEVHVGVVKVPDPRVEALAARELVRKVSHAEIVLLDLPGARLGSLGAEAAKALADADALCLVARAFPGLDGSPPDPVRELREIDGALARADLDIVERRLDRLRKAHGGRTGGEFHELERVQSHLAEGRPLRALSMTEAEHHALAPLGLLSEKPLLVVVNVAEADAGKPLPAAIEAEQRTHGSQALAMCVALEAEIAELDPAEQGPFLESVGLTEPSRERFIHAVYHLLDLVTFFTVGNDEVRAFTVRRGEKAPRAAARIHPDLEKTFSRVEVTHQNELGAAGEKLRPHLEGKEYVVREGDLLRVRTDH